MKHASFEVRKDIYNGILIIDIYLDLKRFDLPILESLFTHVCIGNLAFHKISISHSIVWHSAAWICQAKKMIRGG